MTERVVVTNYQSLIDALRTRVDELQISHALVDQLAGWADGMCSKAIGPSQVKKLGMDNMWVALGTLGIRFVVENDPESLARMEARYERREDKFRRPGNAAQPLGNGTLHRFAKEMGRRGGRKPKRFSKSKEQRSAIYRRNARIGWRKRRERARHERSG